ncbi:MAG: hypothetical protein H6592_12960 [Flavobacteriales bacterium]|nr:hypothetical protein [Flavobacteriales bacterium]
MNTETITACDSYLWTINNTTYTESGTYTVSTDCSTEVLELTINHTLSASWTIPDLMCSTDAPIDLSM